MDASDPVNRVAVDSHPRIASLIGRSIAVLLRHHGFPTHRIAALFDVNQGRVAEQIGRRREKEVIA